MCLCFSSLPFSFFFFFNDPATTEIYTLSLHDALPISGSCSALRFLCEHVEGLDRRLRGPGRAARSGTRPRDRKSTRLNSSHRCISYAVFCLKKKTKQDTPVRTQPYQKAQQPNQPPVAD